MGTAELLDEESKEWRKLFPRDLLEKAEKILKRGRVTGFVCDGQKAGAVLETGPAYRYAVRVNGPLRYEDEWSSDLFSCECCTKRNHSFRRGDRWVISRVCQHEAALLLLWEQQHGPWRFSVPPEVKEARERARREAQEARERALRLRQEQERLNQQRKQEEQRKLRAGEFFPDGEGDGSFFDIKRALRAEETNQYCVNRARALLEAGAVTMQRPTMAYGSDGTQQLCAKGTVKDLTGSRSVSLRLLPDALEYHHCQCRISYALTRTEEICEHELALLSLLREYVLRENPGDATDKAADDFFHALDSLSAASDKTGDEQPRPRRVCLFPRLAVSDGEMLLSYKAGLAGEKQVLLRSYREFLDAAEKHGVFHLSKTVALDFSAMDFTEDSLPWLTFLQRRMSETDAANDSLAQRSYYYSAPSLKVKTRDALTGAVLDRFYELAEGGSIEFQDQDRDDRPVGALRVGHTKLRVKLRSTRIAGAEGAFLGVEIRGTMPRILKGSAGSYVLGTDNLSRVTPEEEQSLRPFRSAADAAGNIRFRVGHEKLAEFYYRVVPRLAESPYVDFEDECAAEAEAILPPEPRFTFRFDLDSDYDIITCEVLVAYGDAKPYSLPRRNRAGEYRDTAQEERAVSAVSEYFPKYLNGKKLFWAEYSEDMLYRVMTEALPAVGRFGQIEGSAAFDRSALRPMPQLRVGVSVESGLLDISVLTKDMEPAELLAVLESYRQKKKYLRLSGGAFLNLAGDRQLAELEDLAAGLDLSLEDAIRGKGTAPMYRALYLDSLLEEHDALAASRDRVYRALVKNFKTIRDADYEAPEAQAETLRPYQVHGYKWLRTLAAAGFGGILADEMGLGKTLQFIALVQALRDAGDAGLCLVVCPASLVYNWQEEFTRFAPGLEVQVMAGPAAARKKRFSDLPGGAVCIASYDLLRQDIEEYRKLSFSLMVLDEAQYIKNQKASMTKAVKAIKAQRRFALTGTPIENRLAELWSIFDYLMPGFLYGYTEFSRRFETPITRQKDPEATERLKRMTAPFILRRCKAEVLKDLPPKLEEVRYTRFEPEQRKIYDGQVVRMKQLVAASGGSGEDRLRIFAELTKIRQICCDPSLLLEDYHGGSAKRTACLELIQSAMAGGHRMLVFSQFTSMLALLEEDLAREGIPYFLLTGATPKEQRLHLVREFNEGDTPVFLISLKAGGTGLNLTGADVVIHYDPWWNLAAQNQATDRAHRIGQRNQVTVYRLIVKDTIEERILAMQEAKRDLADAVLSGESGSLAALSGEELMALLG